MPPLRIFFKNCKQLYEDSYMSYMNLDRQLNYKINCEFWMLFTSHYLIRAITRIYILKNRLKQNKLTRSLALKF